MLKAVEQTFAISNSQAFVLRSYAQRDLFEQVYLDALLQAKQVQQAQNFLKKRALAP